MTASVIADLKKKLDHAAGGEVVVLTGAGISAESGIPTFRGPEGYWTVGSEVYQPEQMATRSMFRRRPEEVWAWYLYRLGVCRAAEPNAAHHALVRMERHLGSRFCLITQNVDGLHRRAGSAPGRMYEIHGHIESVRPSDGQGTVTPLSATCGVLSKGEKLSDAQRTILRRPDGTWLRPHVLWFDESYDEENFFWESSHRAAEQAAVLIVVGTSGATTLPSRIASIAARQGALVVDVNPEVDPFAELALESGGVHLQASAVEAVPKLTELLIERW